MEGQTVGNGLRKASSIDLHDRARKPARTAKRARKPARQRRSGGYTRFVQAMKYFLPVIALCVIVLIVVWPHIQPSDNRFTIGFSSIELGDDADPSMINARYVGTDNENQPFSITADIARQLTESEEIIQLEMPKADVTLNDGTWLVIMSDSGLFERPASYLTLDGAVNLFHDSGYEIHTESAGIDLGIGMAEGDQAVRGHGPFGTIEGDGFRLMDKGKTIIFTGKTKATLFLDQVDSQ